MHKKSLITNDISVNILKFIVIILALFFLPYKIEKAYATTNNWIEVNQTKEGRQFWDRDSLTEKGKGIIEIKTKYIRLESNTSRAIEENIYLMRIDCLNSKYKDVSVNGEINLRPKWEISNKDTLIKEIISDSCKNALNSLENKDV